jgi:hypothetical protein
MRGERVYRSDGSREPVAESDGGPLDVTGSIQLEPNAGGAHEFTIQVAGEGRAGYRAGWNDRGDACADASIAGRRVDNGNGARAGKEWHDHVWSWSFSPQPIEPPPFARIRDALPENGGALWSAVALFQAQVMGLTARLVERLSRAGRGRDAAAFTDPFSADRQAQDEAYREHEQIWSEIVRGAEEAKEGWLSNEPDGAAKEAAGHRRLAAAAARWTEMVRVWIDRTAQSAETVATEAARVNSEDGSRIRELIARWRADWQQFSDQGR